jgi:serine phosphatase RsbU (regulator of sigma subunit)
VTAPDLDPIRLERILAPLNAAGDGPTISIEDPAGVVLAGVEVSDHRAQADVLVDGELVGRVVGADRSSPTGVPADGTLAALAVAIGELVAETRLLRAAERALGERRSTDVAEALGIDVVELAKGRRQQRSILSLVPPDIAGYDLASHYAAARDIGGDLFELFLLARRGRPLAIVIADVTGKGLDAALLMAFSRPVMHSALNAASGPADALARTNRVLVNERRGTLFITALHAILRPRTGVVRIANAGHEPPLLIPADGSPIRPIGDAGVLLGAFRSIEPPEVEVALQPGDRLLFYTDGATDAIDSGGERFGDARLLATLEDARAGSAHDLVAAVRDAIERFSGPTEPADDLTLVAVGRHGRRRRGGTR